MRKETSRRRYPSRRARTEAMPATAFTPMQTPITHLWNEIGQRMLNFAQARTSKLVHANSDLLHVKDPTDLLDVQFRYVRELVEDYSGQAAAIADTCTKCFIHAFDGRDRLSGA